MAKAKKLPSGSWRCLVYDYTDESGKRYYKSFSSSDPSPAGRREAERLAAVYADTKENEPHTYGLTLRMAWKQYIDDRSSVLSPATVREYKRSLKSDLESLMDMKISDISQDMIQKAINHEAKKHSPKSVRNMHGLLSAVLKTYRPNFALNTDLPQKIRPSIYVPSDEEVKHLMQFAEDTVMEIPILLAAFGPMRRGEICALDTKDIKGNTVHVCRNMVMDSNNKWVIKQPKSYAGDRYIEYPDFVAVKWKGKSGRITDLYPSNISDRFKTLLKRADIKPFRFHDLRHYSASIQHALGIPDAYIMQRGGWGNDGVLKAVYRHAMDDKAAQMNKIANSYFEDLCNTKCNTDI